MTDLVSGLAAAARVALLAEPAIAGVTGIYDGPPPRSAYPYLTLALGPVFDWSTKTERGRELRIAVTAWDDGDTPARLHALVDAIGQAIGGIDRDLPGQRIAGLVFVRSLVTRRADGPWAGLVEHRVRTLAL